MQLAGYRDVDFVIGKIDLNRSHIHTFSQVQTQPLLLI